MKTIHYFSGLTIALYVGVHLINHMLVWHSNKLHISVMNSLRKVYRNPVVETFLLAAVTIQVISGITLVFHKWKDASNLFDWLHIGSGLYLSYFLINHVKAVLIGRHKLGMDTNLYYGAGYMNVSPQRFFFIPYYSLAILSFFTHVACIHRIKMSEYVGLAQAQNQSIIIIALGIIVTGLIIYKMSNLIIPSDAFAKSEKSIAPETVSPQH
jgi:hypothetical protein